MDTYREGIILMLKGAEGDGNSNAPPNEQAPAEEHSSGNHDSLQPLHDDTSRFSPDHRLIDDLILELAPRFGLHPRLLHAICEIESNFNVRAVSPRQAKDPFQLIDATSDRFGVTDPFNPRENLLGALRYLDFLTGLYGHQRLDLVLAAYNCGEECVERFGRRVPPIGETRAYVNSVLRLYQDAT